MGKTRRQAIFIFGTFLLLSTVQVALASGAQRHKWWTTDEAQEELKLTDTQVQEIEEIFQSLRPKLRELVQVFRKEEKNLAALLHAMQAEEWEVTLQIDKVEAARGALSKTNMLMLYRMHKKLSDTQVDGLHKLWERRRLGREHRPRRRQ